MLALAGLTLMPGLSSQVGAQSATELRIATVAPEGSPWMQVFRRWDSALRERTGGQVGLTFYPGGSQGQESELIDKMGAGQLDGAAVTSGGLGQIVRPVLVLSAPGVITEYSQLDRARRRMASRFESQFERNGYKLLGWGDIGKARLMSTERIERPEELRQRRPWAPRNDEVFAEFLSVVGASPRRLGIPEVYPALNTRMIDTVPASAIAAVSLQWYTKLRFYSEQNTGVLIGATILKKERFDALSAEHQTALMETSTAAHRLLARAIRREDDRSLRVLSRRMTAVDTSAHEAEWAAAAETTRNNLAGRVYPRALLDAVIRAAGD
ncbi:MAG: TRAP-type C4-dicarboxylate transport system substrate-binding protein [Polyangiales bacterium]|jgi:TRAP-type C4-dicarboxylate transport system substrate-binding protein